MLTSRTPTASVAEAEIVILPLKAWFACGFVIEITGGVTSPPDEPMLKRALK